MTKPTIAIYGIQDRINSEYPRFTHDHSICVMDKGKIVSYLQLERRSRRKYDNRMQDHLEELMDEGYLPGWEEADWVFVNSFVGNSFISRNGRIRFEHGQNTAIKPGLTEGTAWGQGRRWEGKALNGYGIDHEWAHICSNLPFHGVFRENSLMVHFDGGASQGNFSAFLFRNQKVEVLECHWELSHLSKLFNDNALAFAMLNQEQAEHCAVPGKLMGFAAIGHSAPGMKNWLRKNDFFRNCWEDKHEFYQLAKAEFGWEGRLGDTKDSFLQNLAATFQETFTEEWLRRLEKLQAKVNADFLYLSGGCTLNIVANTQIVNSGMFKEVFAPPCPGDSGLSIGAAAFLEWQKHGAIASHSPYLNNLGCDARKSDFTFEEVDKLVQALADGAIVGVFHGPGEAGPRALGNRSILARPDSVELANKVSMDCKGREWYRPLAPVMLERNAIRLTGLPQISHLSRYMLLDFKIPAKNQSLIQGVVHQNGTARIQTVFNQAENPLLHAILIQLDEVHDIPALINTSFNRRGEPIVHTRGEALASAKAMELDAVWIDSELVFLNQKAKYCELERNETL